MLIETNKVYSREDWFNGNKCTLLSIFAVILLLSLTAGRVDASELGDPGKFIMNYVDKGLYILNDPAFKNRPDERRIKLWNEVSPAFNFHEMCKRTVSPSEWKKNSKEKKKVFVEQLTKIVKKAFLGRLDYFSGEEVLYLREIQDDKRAKVQCGVVLNTGKKIVVGYKLLFINDSWTIYDVVIEGVSVADNYRQQFDNFLGNSSFDDLLKKLKEMAP